MFDVNRKATGVMVERAGFGSGSVTYTIHTNRKVHLVSSESFRSPQILMISGIRPAASLQGNGIDIIADRPGVD